MQPHVKPPWMGLLGAALIALSLLLLAFQEANRGSP
jgi:hypothetical protein